MTVLRKKSTPRVDVAQQRVGDLRLVSNRGERADQRRPHELAVFLVERGQKAGVSAGFG